jgi:hypothetical protein
MDLKDKIYLVIQVRIVDNWPKEIEKAFSTREKAEQYKSELEDDFKCSIKFNIFYYEIEELEVF